MNTLTTSIVTTLKSALVTTVILAGVAVSLAALLIVLPLPYVFLVVGLFIVGCIIIDSMPVGTQVQAAYKEDIKTHYVSTLLSGVSIPRKEFESKYGHMPSMKARFKLVSPLENARYLNQI